VNDKLILMENKIARIKALPRIPRRDLSPTSTKRRDQSPTSTKRKDRRHQEISPDRNGWGKKKQELIGTPQSRKRKCKHILQF
jgi:hypothetical protein